MIQVCYLQQLVLIHRFNYVFNIQFYKQFIKNNDIDNWCNGWLGSNLIKLIIENKTEKWGLKKQKIVAFVEKKQTMIFEKYKSNEIEIFEGDLTSQEEIKNFYQKSDNSTLIHTAGVIHPKKYNDFKKINFEVVKNILQNLKKYSIIKSIFISSNSVMGFNKNSQEPFYENTKLHHILVMVLSKKLMENEIHKHMDKNNISIIRTWFYGLNQPSRQIEFLNMIRNNRFPIIGNEIILDLWFILII